MALYWPNKRVALDIVDDPYRRPFEGDESYTVLRVTCADLCDYDSYHKVLRRLGDLLGEDVAEMPEWEDGRLESIEILASDEAEGEIMSRNARLAGHAVRGISYWDGPVPPGSFEEIAPFTRMSTPEYFFFRKANELPFAQAVWLGIELCGRFRTQASQRMGDDGYDYLKQPRTSRSCIRSYLRGTHGSKEGKRARKVLRSVTDECSSPMCCYLYLLLCLPRTQGGYGLEHPLLSAAFAKENHGFVPDAAGSYLAYDLCWAEKHVAVQYTGAKQPSVRHRAALNTEGMRTVCVTDEVIGDAERFDAVAHAVADLAGFTLPSPTDKWRAARDRLRRQISMPHYEHMRLIADEMLEHVPNEGIPCL